MNNKTTQEEEVEALCSIYGSDFKLIDANEYSIEISEGIYKVNVFIKLPPEYPSHSAPNLEISAPNLSRNDKQELQLNLNDIYEENNDEPVLYQWIEKIREFLQKLNKNQDSVQDAVVEIKTPKKNSNYPEIEHGTVIQDRKSIFQGHIANVHSKRDVEAMKEKLLENKKISEATHNISAYRIQMKKSGILQDCDDDGESGAGRRLLHLLQIVDATNVIVVVSRWYGGIQLGPDRFRHINNAARQILQQSGHIMKKK